MVSICYNPEFQEKLLDKLDTKECKEFRRSVPSVQQASMRLKKPTYEIFDRINISTYDLSFGKVSESQFTQEVFELVAFSSRKPPTYTRKDEQDEIIRGKFYHKMLIKVIQQ